MTAPKPPPRTLQPAEERKIQLFLERSAPIVLENPVLTSERWQRLAAVANELDLTADQFHSTIDDLLNRGVIKRMAVTPPKPPPLPGRRPNESSSTSFHPASEDFSLTPPSPPPVQSPPSRLGSDGELHLASETEVSPAEVAPTEPPPAIIESAKELSPQDEFLDRASLILTELRGWGPKSQALISAAAKELGLSDAEARSAINRLRAPEPDSSGSAEDDSKEKFNSTRWRVEGAPAPVPPPAAKTPAETFLDFLRPSLAGIRSDVVPEELEQRLIAHGTRVLGLSTVYARHLLLDVVAERRMKLASIPDSPPVPAAPLTDPKITDFLNVAAPIVAQHRGVNAHSRMLLTALAKERGLTESDMETAIGSMNEREPTETLDRVQKERVEAFRSYLEINLKRVRGILAPALYDKLLTVSSDLFGIGPELAAATIREVASHSQLSVVTHQQAERHLAALLNDLLPPGTEMTRVHRERIELEGAQWGLSAARVDALVAEYRKQAELKALAAERMSQYALTSAVAAAVLVLIFLAWAAISHNQKPETESQPSVKPGAKSIEITSSSPKVEKQKPWIDDYADLTISVFNARTDYGFLRKALNDLSSNDPSQRVSAYDAIAESMFSANDDLRRRDLADLLAWCLALDPADDSAAKLLTTLLRDIPVTDQDPWEPRLVSPMFAGMRTVAIALNRAVGRTSRIAQIVGALHRVTGLTPESSLAANELEQLCGKALSEKLFRSLTILASTKLPNALVRHNAVVTEAGKYVDGPRLQRLNAEFLAADLLTNPDHMVEFEDQVLRIAASRDQLAVLKLVELFERTEHSELREFLKKALLTDLPTTPAGNSVEEVAAFVRKSLGIRDIDDPDGLWNKLNRDARSVLEKASSPPEPATPILAETLRLAHHTTLACALAQNEWSNAAVSELRVSGPKSPETVAAKDSEKESSDATPRTPVITLDRNQAETLRASITALSSRRAQPSDRVAAMDAIGQLAESVSDIPPEAASVLTTYLFGTKSAIEHSRIVERMSLLARWPRLLVAMADRVEEASLNHEQLQSLISATSGNEVSFAEGKEGRAIARRALLKAAMRQFGSSEPVAVQPSGPADNAAAILADGYALQARLMGFAIQEDIATSRNPEGVLRSLVEQLQSRLAGENLSELQRKELAAIPHDLTAVEFLASNDVQKVVLLERAWLKLLTIEAGRRHPEREAEAKKLMMDLKQQDRASDHVLSQLRNGQAAMLQIWMLIAKRG